MRNRLWIALGIILLAACSGGRPQVDRIVENGVEVVLNHVQPYRIAGEPSRVDLEREFVIDAEDPELVAAGLADIRQIAVDSRGSIFIAQSPHKDVPVVFKFDARGRFAGSFGKFGQGPGEIERNSYFGVNARDEVFSLDAPANTVTTFSASGEALRQIRHPLALRGAVPLDSGRFMAADDEVSPDETSEEMTFDLLDENFAKIRTLHRFRFPVQAPGRGRKTNAFLPSPTGCFGPGRIYLTMIGPDYEILVFDQDGNLIRKIRKDYAPRKVTSEFTREALALFPKGSPIANEVSFPEHHPAFQYLFADEAGRLFAMTSERDPVSGQNVCDIFSPSGIYVGRVAVGYFDRLRMIWRGSSPEVVARNGHIYVLHEKDNGYKEVVVYKALWRQ